MMRSNVQRMLRLLGTALLFVGLDQVMRNAFVVKSFLQVPPKLTGPTSDILFHVSRSENMSTTPTAILHSPSLRENSTGIRRQAWWVSGRHDDSIDKQLATYRTNVRTDSLYLTRPMCITILTGYPADKTREPYIKRLLQQMNSGLPLPLPHMSMHLHVFCEGNCSHLTTLLTSVKFSSQQFHSLKPVATAKDKRIKRLTENYRTMFDYLLGSSSPEVEYCGVIEDDLILSPDALILLNLGMRAMQVDASIFTLSLFNDNAIPLYSHNASAFTLVSHFAGLGFVMSAKWYSSIIVPSWQANIAWDSSVQISMAKARLCSIIPEVTRSWHVRNRTITYDDAPLPTPKDLFESHLLNREIRPSYDLRHLQQNKYDQYIRWYLTNGISISKLEDALYFVNANNLIMWKCPNQQHLAAMLSSRHLFHMGNGKMVRGSYKGVLRLRIYTSSLLIVCADSPFFSASLVNRKLFRPPDSSFISGIHYRLHTNYKMVLGQVDADCDVTCSSVARTCDIRGLALLREDCTVILRLYPQCHNSCKEVVFTKTSRPYTGHYPGITEQGTCTKGLPLHLSCAAHAPGIQRLCPCL